LIASLKENKDANIDILLPEQWLPGSKSVLSFFLPFARWITEENSGGCKPSGSWLHGRIEGQQALNNLSAVMVEKIRAEGFEALSPSLDPRMKIYPKAGEAGGGEYTSNWSERHIAFAAGLGTFGLSRNLITSRGSAGRFFSIITKLVLPQTKRAYESLYEYCSGCGACVRACPPKAISKERLKEHPLCDSFLKKILEEEDPYYGCGKCQCGVPCSGGIPQSAADSGGGLI
jgi:epoxyqueuosine reductase QueG